MKPKNKNSDAQFVVLIVSLFLFLLLNDVFNHQAEIGSRTPQRDDVRIEQSIR